MLVTGHSGQSLDWIAEHSDGWLYYPRDFKIDYKTVKHDTHECTKYPWAAQPLGKALVGKIVGKKDGIADIPTPASSVAQTKSSHCI